jgi:hypothetical protein
MAIVNIGSPHECTSSCFVKSEPELPAKWVDMTGDPIGEEIKIVKWVDIK